MRLVAQIDNKINKEQSLALLGDFAAWLNKHVGIELQYWVERKDFTNVPTVPDTDGDLKPTTMFRKELETDVHNRYGDYGTDDILMWVHEDNFLYKGIWGSAWAYNFFKYLMYLCRWDKESKVNTLNTLIHEWSHPLDRLILEELKIDINPIIRDWYLVNGTKADRAYITANGFNWDRDFTHGGLPSVAYIGAKGYTYSKANLQPLTIIAPLVKQAYAKRKELHFKPVTTLQKQLIELLLKLLKK